MKIKLPIFYHTDETTSLKSVGVDYQLEDCEIKEITFYNIDAISPNIEEDKEYCTIFSSGDEFTCSLSYKEVEYLIDKSL